MEGHTCVFCVFLWVKVEPLYNWWTVYHPKPQKDLINFKGGNNMSPYHKDVTELVIKKSVKHFL